MATTLALAPIKNFATYDIVCKMPRWISLLSLTIGVFALFIPALADNVVSATLIIIGVATLYVQFYDSTKEEYKIAGDAHTQIFNQFEVVYRNVKSEPALITLLSSRRWMS